VKGDEGGQDNADEKMLGLTGGGQAIQKCRDRFKKFLKVIVDVASL
jgi:hypothetical protein